MNEIKKYGSLTLVGSGIKFLSHITHETIQHIKQADKVVYLSNDPLFCKWVGEVSRHSKSLAGLYYNQSARSENYKGISDYVVSLVECGFDVCFIIYGHPIVFSQPGLHAANQLRSSGYRVKILPAISAEDCLYADLFIDPGSKGCLSYEATDFLVYDRPVCPASHLIIWQISSVGVLTNRKEIGRNEYVALLQEKLLSVYPLDHEVILYVAAKYPGFQPNINVLSLSDLEGQYIHRFSSLYVKPYVNLSANQALLDKLKIS